jgi:hypothetical protein
MQRLSSEGSRRRGGASPSGTESGVSPGGEFLEGAGVRRLGEAVLTNARGFFSASIVATLEFPVRSPTEDQAKSERPLPHPSLFRQTDRSGDEFDRPVGKYPLAEPAKAAIGRGA